MNKRMNSEVAVSKKTSLGAHVCDNASGLINKEDLSMIRKEQKTMLEQLEKTNQMLTSCNNISEKEYSKVVSRFQQHTTVLCDMKKDLQYIHTHIRQLKTTLHKKHPETLSLTAGSNGSKKTATSITGLDNNETDQEENESFPVQINEKSDT